MKRIVLFPMDRTLFENNHRYLELIVYIHFRCQYYGYRLIVEAGRPSNVFYVISWQEVMQIKMLLLRSEAWIG